jgi:hypothetical protein
MRVAKYTLFHLGTIDTVINAISVVVKLCCSAGNLLTMQPNLSHKKCHMSISFYLGTTAITYDVASAAAAS